MVYTPRETWRKIVKFDRVVEDDSSWVMAARHTTCGWQPEGNYHLPGNSLHFAVVDKIKCIVGVLLGNSSYNGGDKFEFFKSRLLIRICELWTKLCGQLKYFYIVR